jgi:hypothetical protein
MKLWIPAFLSGAVCASLLLGARAPSVPPGPQDKPGAEDMAAMMAKAAKYTQPGEHHKLLERFLGKWDTASRITMAGENTEWEKGTSEVTWLMEGRWLQSKGTGSMMGMPVQFFSVMGYDSFKQSYVATSVNSLDTAMSRSEGDMDPGGKALLLYGTIDEYLTGEHDKMVKYVWRLVSDDKVVMEVHDLPIGETNTKVIEVVSTRKK